MTPKDDTHDEQNCTMCASGMGCYLATGAALSATVAERDRLRQSVDVLREACQRMNDAVCGSGVELVGIDAPARAQKPPPRREKGKVRPWSQKAAKPGNSER